MQKQHPYFSNTNVQMVFNIIQKHIHNRLGYNVNKNIIPQVVSVMKLVYQEFRIHEKKLAPKKFMNLINKKALDQIIPMITESIQEQQSRFAQQQYRQGQQGQQGQQVRQTQYQQGPQGPQIQSNNQGRNLENMYSQMVESRIPDDTMPPMPNFQDPVNNDYDDPEKLYESLNVNRNIVDQLPIPTEIPDFLKGKQHQIKTPEFSTNIADLRQDTHAIQENHIDNRDKLIKFKGVEAKIKQQQQKKVSFEDPISTNHLIIPKTSRNLLPDSKHIPHYLAIDSRDRNQNTYPDSYHYKIELKEYLKDVLSIELLSAEIPKTDYLIHENNNLLHFSEGTDLIATIPIGNYDIVSLTSEIETQMNAVGANVYTVNVNTLNNLITISTGVPFDLNFNGGTELYLNEERTIYPENSIAPVLGFSRNTLTGSTSYTSQGSYNLICPYLLIHIENLETIESNSQVDTAFAKIPLDIPTNTIKYFEKNDYKKIKYFSPPLGKLQHLIISFKKYDGTYYNFRNHENSLFFRIVTKEPGIK